MRARAQRHTLLASCARATATAAHALARRAPPTAARSAQKDRVWLAVDHTVDPRNYGAPKPSALIKLSHEFAKVRGAGAREAGAFAQCVCLSLARAPRDPCSHTLSPSLSQRAQETDITDFWPENTTIMHTEFARQRAQPGQIVIGADSHTCSAGGMGAFACGLGAADVTVPLVTGQTWCGARAFGGGARERTLARCACVPTPPPAFRAAPRFKVPETVLIEFVGRPSFGVGGKDVILHVLGALKRNTVALDRAVEFRGPGLAHLSSDARFAVAKCVAGTGARAWVGAGERCRLALTRPHAPLPHRPRRAA